MTPHMDMLGAEECASLACRIRKGDRAAEDRLVSLYRDCVFALALARTHDCEVASELTDDVLMAVIVALRHGAVRDCGRVGGYVHGTALNAVRGYFRRQRRQGTMVALDPGLVSEDSCQAYDAEDRQKMARDAMSLLDARDRQILALSLSEGLKPGEIAARLGISAAVVRQRKCRALRTIVAFVGGDARVAPPATGPTPSRGGSPARCAAG